MRHFPLLLVLLLVAVSPRLARADVPAEPPPTRPEWDDAPAPLPDPPDEVTRRLLPAALVALAAGTALILVRGRRRAARDAS